MTVSSGHSTRRKSLHVMTKLLVQARGLPTLGSSLALFKLSTISVTDETDPFLRRRNWISSLASSL